MRVITIGAAVVLIVLGVLLLSPAPIADLDSKVCDLLTRQAGPGTLSKQVAIVEIDERSLAKFGRWPWPRDLVGRLSRGILKQGAAMVVLDMVFPQEDRGNDEVLAEALRGGAGVVGYILRFDRGGSSLTPCSVPSLPLAIAGPNEPQGVAFFHATGSVCTVPAISGAAAGNGFLNASPDHDGLMRRIPLLIEERNRLDPSLALAAINVYRHVSTMQLTTNANGARLLELDKRAVPVEGASLLRLRFRGAARKFPYVSAADVLSGGVPEELRGKIAVVGGSAAGMQYPVVTPVDPLFPDVEIQATAIDNLLVGDSFHRPVEAHFWELAFALLAGSASIWLLTRPPRWWGVLAILGLGIAAWVGCVLVLAFSGMLVSPLPVTVMLGCNLPVLMLVSYLQEKRRADRTQQQLTAAMRRSLEVLRESESRYHRLVDNINDAIVVDDIEGRLVFANRRFSEWFGLQATEIGTIMLEQYVAPEWRAEVRDRHDSRMRGEAVSDHFEFEGIRSNGTRIWIEALVTKVEEGGKIVGTQAALRDTTERKRIEAEYLQARKLESVGRLAGGVAHDFNNLLTVINAYSDLLLDKVLPGDPTRRGLEEIRKAGNRAAELTKKLLAFSRKQPAKPRPVNLNLIVAESEKMLELLIGEDIQLITRLAPSLGFVNSDPAQMHQVLMNLLVNARDAMPNGGSVIVETRDMEAAEAANPSVYLGVTDYGTGMSDEVKQHLYEPFFTTKEPGKGTGLGLATVYGIVYQMGGRIEVASELGKGTTFHIYLPRVQPPVSGQPVAPDAALSLRGTETVLVVEDQDAVRQIAITILQNYGYMVLQASNGPEALALAERYSGVIHLLLTDIIMPLMDGRMLAAKLRSVRPDIKVLFVSGYSEEKLGSSRSLEADLPHLSKPFTPEVLATRVRQILADGGNRRQSASS